MLEEKKTDASLINYHLVEVFLAEEKKIEYILSCDLFVKVGVVEEDNHS